MTTVNVREAREKIAQLLDAVAAGEDIVILRRGQPAARIVGIEPASVQFPDRQALRNSLPRNTASAADDVRQLRNDERY